MFFWVHDFSPQPVLLDFGVIKIYWYGLLVVLAILAGILFANSLVKKRGLNTEHLFNLFFYLVIFGIIGARIYHVIFYNFDYFINQPLNILKFWEGGLAIHGAIIAGIFVIVIYCQKHRLEIFKYLDIMAVVLPLGQAIGRWGNFFNQELFGKPCDSNWCIFIEPLNRPSMYQTYHHFMPLFLFEFVLNIILFIILFAGYQSKKWPLGAATYLYLIGYSIIRFFMEFYRLDVDMTVFGLKWVQWLCLSVIIIFGCRLLSSRNKQVS